MKANKSILDDIGGAFSISTTSTQRSAAPDATSEADSDVFDQDFEHELDHLYALPIEPIPVRRQNAHSIKTRLKAKRMAEARLIRLSEELSKLADDIRYLNPLMAETVDEAWEATEDAIEMLSNPYLW